jgi:hypothetical protein
LILIFLQSKGNTMKKVVTLATTMCFFSMSAFAGGMGGKLSDAVVEPPVEVPVVPVAGSSAGNTGLIAAGAGLLLLAALAASSSSSSTTTTTTE